MAYEELGSVEVVVLGGVDKSTGKANPKELEGYLLGIEQRPNKFNLTKPQNFYIFQTKEGSKGVYGKAGIDSVLKGAKLGAMTKLIATGQTLDTGKGNPMKVFKGFQDKTNTIDVSGVDFSTESHSDSESDASEHDSSVAEIEAYETPVAKAPTPISRASSSSAASHAAVQALLASRRK